MTIDETGDGDGLEWSPENEDQEKRARRLADEFLSLRGNDYALDLCLQDVLRRRDSLNKQEREQSRYKQALPHIAFHASLEQLPALLDELQSAASSHERRKTAFKIIGHVAITLAATMMPEVADSPSNSTSWRESLWIWEEVLCEPGRLYGLETDLALHASSLMELFEGELMAESLEEVLEHYQPGLFTILRSAMVRVMELQREF